MSSIDPAPLQSTRSTAIPGFDDQQFDPATVLLALSVSQLGILRESLLARVPSLKDQYETLGRIGQTTNRLGKLHDTVLRGEQRDAQDLLQQLEAFRTKQLAGEENSLVVNDSQQQDLANALEWARQRGFSGSELTRQVATPNPPAADGETAAAESDGEQEPAVEMQTVIDQQALLAFRDTLSNYVASLKTGDVDNPAIRHRLTNHADFASIQADAAALGVSGNLDSPAKIRAAIGELETRFNQILTAARQASQEARSLVGLMEKSATDLESLNRSQFLDDARGTERKLDHELTRLQDLELDETRRNQLQELLDALISAESALAKFALQEDVARQVAGDLPAASQREFQTQLAAWRHDLNSLLQPQPATRPETRLLRPASAYV